MLTNRRGFTLVEIMLVVLIIGMLGAIAAGSHLRARERSQQVLCIKNRQAIEAAEARYVLDLNEHSLTMQSLVSAGYIKEYEPCPAGGDYAWVEYDEGSPLYRSVVACSVHGTATGAGGGDGGDGGSGDDDGGSGGGC
jgi:prepilin-type N-terminal cleavage/methylation domain-containing protein